MTDQTGLVLQEVCNSINHLAMVISITGTGIIFILASIRIRLQKIDKTMEGKK